MNKDKAYYQSLLHQLQYTQLEIVGEVLQIELAVYDVRKLLQEMSEIDEYDNPKLENLKSGLVRLRKKHEVLVREIDDLELDISHCKFMIENLSRNADDE
ncbi:hypothetical protein [Spirosoma koreense]